jgi:hypothetical protein
MPIGIRSVIPHVCACKQRKAIDGVSCLWRMPCSGIIKIAHSEGGGAPETMGEQRKKERSAVGTSGISFAHTF